MVFRLGRCIWLLALVVITIAALGPPVCPGVDGPPFYARPISGHTGFDFADRANINAVGDLDCSAFVVNGEFKATANRRSTSTAVRLTTHVNRSPFPAVSFP
jgi:hypothetical protein